MSAEQLARTALARITDLKTRLEARLTEREKLGLLDYQYTAAGTALGVGLANQVTIEQTSSLLLEVGRQYKVTCGFRAMDLNTAADILQYDVKLDGSTSLIDAYTYRPAPISSYPGSVTQVRIVDGDGSSHTFDLTGYFVNYSGNVYGSMLMVEDVTGG